MKYTINDAMLILLLTLKEIPEAQEEQLHFTINTVAQQLKVNCLDLFYCYKDWQAGQYTPEW